MMSVSLADVADVLHLTWRSVVTSSQKDSDNRQSSCGLSTLNLACIVIDFALQLPFASLSLGIARYSLFVLHSGIVVHNFLLLFLIQLGQVLGCDLAYFLKQGPVQGLTFPNSEEVQINLTGARNHDEHEVNSNQNVV